VATALLVAGSTLTFWIPPFTSTSSYSSVVKALGCSCACRRLAYGSFQLTHTTTLFNWSSHGGQDDNKTLLQRSQRCHKGVFRHVSISARQQSLRCGQNFRGPFLKLHCRWQLDHALERWRTRGDKRAHNSTTKASFCTIVRFCYCIAITMV